MGLQFFKSVLSESFFPRDNGLSLAYRQVSQFICVIKGVKHVVMQVKQDVDVDVDIQLSFLNMQYISSFLGQIKLMCFRFPTIPNDPNFLFPISAENLEFQSSKFQIGKRQS